MKLTEKLDRSIRTIPDFPKPGIQFKDITPVLSDPVLCQELAEALAKPFQKQKIDLVVGVESRGFIFGVLIAQHLKCGFTLIRKKGKLPSQTVEMSYDLEYGRATIEMHADAISRGDRVLIHDDLLATGGTSEAAASLIQAAGGIIAGFNFIVELDFLKGRDRLKPYSDKIVSIVNY